MRSELELKMLKTRGWRWREGVEAGRDDEGGAGSITNLRIPGSRLTCTEYSFISTRISGYIKCVFFTANPLRSKVTALTAMGGTIGT